MNLNSWVIIEDATTGAESKVKLYDLLSALIAQIPAPSIPGIDDVLAQNQNLTADRYIGASNHSIQIEDVKNFEVKSTSGRIYLQSNNNIRIEADHDLDMSADNEYTAVIRNKNKNNMVAIESDGTVRIVSENNNPIILIDSANPIS